MVKRTSRRTVDMKYAGEVNGVPYGVRALAGGNINEPSYCRSPCAQCPWVKGRTGAFPPDAYRFSASTSEDMANNIFGCHMAGLDKSLDCAGFLLQGAAHNLGVRLKVMKMGKWFPGLSDGGLDLYPNYRAMAVANGVPADDPALALCRDDQ